MTSAKEGVASGRSEAMMRGKAQEAAGSITAPDAQTRTIRRRGSETTFLWLVPTLYIVFLMLPIYWLLNMSFKTTNEILGGFGMFPRNFTTASYVEILTNPVWYNGYISRSPMFSSTW